MITEMGRLAMRRNMLGGALITAVFLASCSGAPATTAPTRTVAPATQAPVATSEPSATTAPTTPAISERTFTVERGDVIDDLTLEGVVAAAEQQTLSFPIGGFVTDVYVEVGDQVEAGQLLIEIDATELEQQIAEIQLERRTVEAEINRVTRAASIEVRRAQIDLDEARAELAELRTPPSEDAIVTARAAVRQAQADLEQVRNNASATKTKAEQQVKQAEQALIQIQQEFANVAALKDSRSVEDRETYLRAETALRTAEAELTKAKVDLDTARQNEVLEIEVAEAEVQAAQAALTRTERGATQAEINAAQRKVQRAELEVEQARLAAAPDPDVASQLEALELELETIRQQMENTRIVSPIGGVVAALQAAPGFSVNALDAVVTVADPASLELQLTNVDGADAARLTPGLETEISFVRYPSKTFTGTLERISTSNDPENGPLDVFHISYDPQGDAFDLGDTAQVRVIVARRENVLWLPPIAIDVNGVQRSVIVQEGGEQREVPIEVGVAASDRVEIVSGLDEGAVVIEP
jgi:HlyD family secretion protein